MEVGWESFKMDPIYSKVNVSNQQTFWFDQIQYAPSASASLNQSFLRIDSTDPAIQYSSSG